MAESGVKLLGYALSPFVVRPRIALNIKSIEYEFLEEKLGLKSELLLQSNPVHKKIPVLVHGDKPVCESLVIVEYIDEAWSSGPSILPSDPVDRAIERFWASYIDEKASPEPAAKKALLEQVKEGLVLLEDAFEKCSKGKGFFGGDRIGLVDIALGSFLGWLQVIDRFNGVKLLNEDNTPSLLKWAHAFSAHQAVKTVVPQTEKLVQFAISVLKINNSSDSN